MASLAGKTAMITGASKGIGKAAAITLARAGANIVINYSSDDAAAQELVSSVTSSLPSKTSVPSAVAAKADAGNPKELAAMVDKVVELYCKIDILICNAGIMPIVDLEHTTEETFDKVMKTNVKDPFPRPACHMPSGSHIIFLSTTLNAASTVTRPYLVYCASKGAIEQMTRVVSKDLAKKGISVIAVAPGPTGTELFLKGKDEQALKMIAGFNPHNRIGTPEEIADVLLWLSGSGSGWVTGQIVRVNGGMA